MNMNRKLALCVLAASFVGCSSQPTALPFSTATDGALVVEFLVRKSDPTIRLPLPKGFSYDFTVDWNDGTESEIDAYDDPDALHTYDRIRTYRVTISGKVESWSFWKVPHSKDRIITVEDLGDVGWKSLAGAFYDCNLLESLAGGDTSSVTDMSYMYHRSPLVVPDTSAYDTGNVTTMRAMFDGASSAKPDVRGWDTARVRDMSGLFARTDAARPQTSNWDTSEVVLMSDMFRAAMVANPDVSRWDTSNVADMSSMFNEATVANPHVTDWNVASVVSMYAMFKNAASARPDMSRWDFGNVRFMDDMFKGVVLPTATYSRILARAAITARRQRVVLHAGKKTQYSLDSVDHRKFLVEDMQWQITDGGLDTSSQVFSTRWEVTSGDLTIELPLVCDKESGGQYDYNFRVNWGDGLESTVVKCDDDDRLHTYTQAGAHTVTIEGLLEAWSFKKVPRSRDKLTNVWNLGSMGWKSLQGAFENCKNLTTVAGGNTSLVTDMSYVFHGAEQADPNVSGWNTSKVTDMKWMFKDAAVARPNISNWDVSSVTDMRMMFKDAARAEPDMSGWNFAKVRYMDEMFVGVKLPTTTYDKMLLCLCSTSQNKGIEVNLHGGNSKYSRSDYNAEDLPCNRSSVCTDADGQVIRDAESARNQLDKNEDGRWTINDGGLERIPAPFMTRWYLPNGGTIKLPLVRRKGLFYALEVEWCDGERNSISGDEWELDNATHNCPAPVSSDLEDLPTVTISGSIGSGRWSCRDFAGEGRCDNLYAVDDLGDLKWKNLSGAFAFAESLVVFKGGNHTSEVTDMSLMFWKSPRVRPDVLHLDVSKVENMQGMFQEAFSANPDVSDWNTSKAKNISWMFAKTRQADPDVSSWNTSLVTNTKRMFSEASAANPDISNWFMGRVTDMSYMFYRAGKATLDVAQWDTAQVVNMSGVFRRADKAKPDVSRWDTSGVTDMSYMFADTKLADPDVSNWNVSSVTNMRSMFRNALVASPVVDGWDTERVTNMSNMFNAALRARPNVSTWGTHSVTNMSGMFRDAPRANPDVSDWYVARVTNMSQMFMNAVSAEPDVSNWNVSRVTDMAFMFTGAKKVGKNLNVESWNFAQVEKMGAMFEHVTLPTSTYTKMLMRIEQTTTKKNVSLHGGSSKYTAQAATARSRLIKDKGWEITDGGLE